MGGLLSLASTPCGFTSEGVLIPCSTGALWAEGIWILLQEGGATFVGGVTSLKRALMCQLLSFPRSCLGDQEWGGERITVLEGLFLGTAQH